MPFWKICVKALLYNDRSSSWPTRFLTGSVCTTICSLAASGISVIVDKAETSMCGVMALRSTIGWSRASLHAELSDHLHHQDKR